MLSRSKRYPLEPMTAFVFNFPIGYTARGGKPPTGVYRHRRTSFTGIHCITLYSHCQEDVFFRLVLSVVLPCRRELVAHRVHHVLCSEFFHPIHLALQMDSLPEDLGRFVCRRSVRVILDCPYCITMYSQNQPQICISLGRNFVRMVYHTPVGYHDCQPWLAGSTLVVRD